MGGVIVEEEAGVEEEEEEEDIFLGSERSKSGGWRWDKLMNECKYSFEWKDWTIERDIHNKSQNKYYFKI